MKRIIFTILLSIIIGKLSSQCNAPSYPNPDYYFYSGPASNFVISPSSPINLHLCNNAIVYDTTYFGDRFVMIEQGAQYIWKPCGPMLSQIWIKSGGTVIFQQVACPTSRDIYIEPGATIIDPYNTMASNTVTNSCVAVTFLAFNCSVGVFETEKPSFSLSPNPTNSILNITNEHNQLQNTIIEIKNTLGQTVLSTPFSKQLNISELSSGVYFLTVQSKTGNKTIKIIKE